MNTKKSGKSSSINSFSPKDSKIDTYSLQEANRIYALDTLRGISIILMIALHYYWFLKSNFFETKMYIQWAVNFICIVANPIFIMVMGVVLVISLDDRQKKGKNFKDNLIHLIKRFLLFFVMNQILVVSYILYFGVDTTFSMPNLYPGWIPSLGINAIICLFLLYFKKLYRFFFMVGIEFLTELKLVPFWGIIDYPSLFYMIFGTLIGSLFLEAKENGNFSSFQKKILISGIILFSIGLPSEFYLMSTFNLTIPHNTYQYAPFFTMWALGLFSLLFAILYWIQDYNKKSKRKAQPIMIFSNLSLTIFYFHLVLMTDLFIFFMGNLLSVYSYLLFLICFDISIYLMGIIWARKNYIYSLEWLLRKYS